MQQLRHLCAVVDHGQIGAAAKAVAITQPALSRSIHNLERALGVQLLERSHEGVVPTVYGQLFVEHARTVVNEMKRARDNLQALRGLARGKVTFGITANFERYLLPRVLGRLMSDNPAISIYAMTGFYEDISVRVRTGELDFAFALLPPMHGHEDLVEEKILPVRSHVYAPSTHPLATRRDISLAEIASQVWIVPDQAAHRTYERYFEVLGLSAPPSILKTPSIPLMLAMLRTAQVVGLFPDHIVQDGIKSGEVVKLNVHDLPELTHAALVCRRDTVISPAARTLMDAIRSACQAVAGKMAGAPPPKSPRSAKNTPR